MQGGGGCSVGKMGRWRRWRRWTGENGGNREGRKVRLKGYRMVLRIVAFR